MNNHTHKEPPLDNLPILNHRSTLIKSLQASEENILHVITMLQSFTHSSAQARGLYNGVEHKKPDGEKIALMHADLSKAMLAICEGHPPSTTLPHHDELEVKLADLIIRILDYAEWKKLDLGPALVEKIIYNFTREIGDGL